MATLTLERYFLQIVLNVIIEEITLLDSVDSKKTRITVFENRPKSRINMASEASCGYTW